MILRVLTVFGTRPEAIKMAPVILGLEQAEGIKSLVCVSAQHRQMLDPVLDLFGIRPDYDLNIMQPKQDLHDITSNILLAMRKVLRKCKPDFVLVHGDTTTCFAAALAVFYEQIKIGHVEAGLRTGNLVAPFPEEANRSLVSRIATHHFAPTERAKQNLLTENIAEESITVTGNTVIDALLMVRDTIKQLPADYWKNKFGENLYKIIVDPERKLILITAHRRENFGQGFVDLCNAIKTLADNHPDWNLIFPVHLNPNVQRPVNEILGSIENVFLIAPQDYAPFVWLMDKSTLILTDSGGIQEEAVSLNKPVVVMREVTERPEAVDTETVYLVGTVKEKIINTVEDLILGGSCYSKISNIANPYGDGKAATKIINYLTKYT